MADMPNEFWSGWIIVITLFSLAGLAWLAISIYFLPPADVDENDEPVWDSNIREGSNSIPHWWFWMLLGTMVFTSAYLMLYPGLGSFSGAFRWSQSGELQTSQDRFNAEFAAIEEEIIGSTVGELQARPEVMKSAQSLFNEHCSACHGYEAQGQAALFPNLRDDEWQWGGTPEQIEQTIRNGRIATMISWQALLNDEGVNNVSAYVVNALGTDNADGHAGQAQYNQFCIACHGINGDGNLLLGAPNLANDLWLYGGSMAAVVESIANGRSGEMPAFDSRLDDAQIKMLVAWLTTATE